MVKLQEYKNQYFVTIPCEIVEKKKWKKGQKLIVSFNERGNVEIMDTS
jgi:hypothetical protein